MQLQSNDYIIFLNDASHYFLLSEREFSSSGYAQVCVLFPFEDMISLSVEKF